MGAFLAIAVAGAFVLAPLNASAARPAAVIQIVNQTTGAVFGHGSGALGRDG